MNIEKRGRYCMEMAFRRNHKNQDTRTSLERGKSISGDICMVFGCTVHDFKKVLVALIFTALLPWHHIGSHHIYQNIR